MGYDAGDDHGQSKEGPQKHDDEGADGGEEKSVSGRIGSQAPDGRKACSTVCLIPQKTAPKGGLSCMVGVR